MTVGVFPAATPISSVIPGRRTVPEQGQSRRGSEARRYAEIMGELMSSV